MSIPRVIHQTWKNEQIPSKFNRMSLSWKEKHAGWKYHFWTDEMNRNFITEHFPSFTDRYDAYSTNIQRVDAVRYFILYKYGGVFIDLDFECLVNITPLLENAACVFGREPDEHCLIHHKNQIISNAFMAAIPGHDFFRTLCNELYVSREVTDHPNDRILETTGPFMLSRLIDGYREKEGIRILNAELIYPLSKEELLQYEEQENPDGAIMAKVRNAYAIHFYAGTWWKKGEMI